MIHALPGMGADRRMFPGPWTDLPDLKIHNWVKYSGEESLLELAQAMCEACDIRDGDTLVGASLGGMVACEISRIRHIPKLHLLGSAVSKTEINALLAALHPLARIAPIDWIRLSAGKIPTEATRMFSECESRFVRAMCEAIFRWEGLVHSDSQVFRIHGKHDRVIPPPPNPDLLLEAGHLISMTHAAECVDFVRRNT